MKVAAKPVETGIPSFSELERDLRKLRKPDRATDFLLAYWLVGFISDKGRDLFRRGMAGEDVGSLVIASFSDVVPPFTETLDAALQIVGPQDFEIIRRSGKSSVRVADGPLVEARTLPLAIVRAAIVGHPRHDEAVALNGAA